VCACAFKTAGVVATARRSKAAFWTKDLEKRTAKEASTVQKAAAAAAPPPNILTARGWRTRPTDCFFRAQQPKKLKEVK